MSQQVYCLDCFQIEQRKDSAGPDDPWPSIEVILSVSKGGAKSTKPPPTAALPLQLDFSHQILFDSCKKI